MTQIEKTQYLEALRSNHYPQTHGRLHDSRGYCCIGVACVVRGIELVPDVYETGILYEASGLDEITRAHLIRMNDAQNCTFAEIADWVESNLIPIPEV